MVPNQDVSLSSESQEVLIRLLAKLTLIPPEHTKKIYPTTELCPIAYFAREGLLNSDIAIKKVSETLSIPVFEVDKSNFQRLVLTSQDHRLAKISVSKWRGWRAIPIEYTNSTLHIAIANPLAQEVRRELEFELGCGIEVSICDEGKILQVLAKQSNSSETFTLDNIIDQATPDFVPPSPVPGITSDSTVFEDDIESQPVVRLVNKVLSDATEKGASDIHIEPERESLSVRIRVDGILQPLFTIPTTFQNPVISRIKLLSGMDIAEKRRPQDGRFRIKTGYGVKDLRVSSIPTVYGENIVVRILSSDLSHLDFATLGMKSALIKRIKRSLRGTSRVVLATGPTGSGKTSTLYSALLSMCDGKSNIITIEDPIEYRISHVNQIQVNPKIGLTFAEGLRSIVRQDPDVVMVGEIRDHETAAIAMQVAQTGHLVLSTFHTNTAASAITRLRDMGIPPYIIASSLGAIIAQRLVRKLCPHCAVPIHGEEIERATESGLDPAKLKQAVGCMECNQFGYSGRTGIYSFLEITDALQDAIRTEKGEREIETLARENGFQPLEEAAKELLDDGVTSLDEVERVIGPLDFREKRSKATTLDAAGQVSSVERSGKRKVLLVEDDENTRSILSLLLQGEFYDVEEAANGFEGPEKAHQSKPELIISDLMMPKMNGLQMVQKLRADARTREIPVLMLTAADTEENEVQLINSGADDFVHKASDTRVLLARVQRLLDR